MKSFTQHGSSKLYTVTGSTSPYRLFYYWQGEYEQETGSEHFTLETSNPPPTIEALASWYDNVGFYVFCAGPVSTADLDTLASNLKTYSSANTLDHTSCLWLEGHAAAIATDNSLLLSFTTMSAAQYPATETKVEVGFPPYEIPIPKDLQAWPVWNPAHASGTNHDQDVDLGGLLFKSIPGQPTGHIPFGPNFWEHREDHIYLRFEEEAPGRVEGRLFLQQVDSDEFRAWNGGMVLNVQGATSSGPVYFPLLELASSELMEYKASLRPFAPGDSSFGFMDRSVTLTGPPQLQKISWDDDKEHVVVHGNINNLSHEGELYVEFFSAFRDRYGRTLTLTPHWDARLRIGTYSLASGGGHGTLETHYYLMPEGNFEVGYAPETGVDSDTVDLLCGIEGTEFIRLNVRTITQQGDSIEFIPLTSKAKDQLIANPQLTVDRAQTTDYTTIFDMPWARITPGETSSVPIYFAQPEQASMYSHHSGDKVQILRSEDLENTTISTQTHAFPMLPFAVAHPLSPQTSWQDIREAELHQLARTRKHRINAVTPPLRIDNNVSQLHTATPQGFIAKVQPPGTHWSSLLLTQTVDGTAGTQSLQFLPSGSSYLPNPLVNALQSSQLFMVMSEGDASTIGELQGALTLEEWPFTIELPDSVSSPDELGNVIIFKFCEGTIKDLVLNTSRWSSADEFNPNETGFGPKDVGSWISDYISEAELEASKVKAGQTSWLQPFVDLVNNPSWQGVIALKVDVNVAKFPKQLAGLLAGIDLQDFYGHHLGFEMNHVDNKTSNLKINDPSIFGLINYVATDSDQKAVAVKGPYNFTVMNLQVIFKNSIIENFASKLHLTAHQWLGDDAQLQVNTGISSFTVNAIELDGHLEHHNGTDVYTFVTQPGSVYRYAMDSKALRFVTFTQAKFNTLHINTTTNTQPDYKETVEQIETAFSLSGKLNFADTGSIDVFSFGNEVSATEGQAKGLQFSNLLVNMNFTLDSKTYTKTIPDHPANTTTNVVLDKTLFQNVSGLVPDTATSDERKQSWYNKFPLSLKRFTYNHGSEDTLSHRGYLPLVVATDQGFSPLGETWYALEYNLNFGSAGALASTLDFSPGIIVAWSPGSSLQAEVGIKLPGTGGAKKLLSLEGVLHLDIGEMLLHAVGEEDDLAYLLSFYNIGLKFLGIKLPLAGSINAALFGDPDGHNHDSSSALGWYAGYSNLKKKKKSGGGGDGSTLEKGTLTAKGLKKKAKTKAAKKKNK